MIRIQEILDKVSAGNPNADLELIQRAYVFAATAHAGQTRLSGEPYLSHPLAVASILAGMGFDEPTIAAGLLLAWLGFGLLTIIGGVIIIGGAAFFFLRRKRK